MRVGTSVFVSLAILLGACGGGAGAVSGAEGIPITWSRLPHDESVLGGQNDQVMSGVTAGGPGFVSVGWDDGLTPRAAAVWTSEDGTSWERVPHNVAVFGDGILMRDVVVGGPGLVAVGQAGGGFRAGAVLTSADGLTWERVPHDEAIFEGEDWAWMHAVAVGGPGLVAVGGAGSGERDAAAWTSEDGLTWTPVPHDDAVFGGAGHQEILSITAGGPGLVAVGRDIDLEHDSDAAVWTSPDGVTWTRVQNEDEVFGGEDDQEMVDVVAGGPGLVAVGLDWAVDSPPDAAVWTSTDGLSWSRVSHDGAIFGGSSYQQMLGVTAIDDGLVAVGLTLGEDDASAQESAVWTSPDGVSWSRLPHDGEVLGGPEDQEMRDVASDGSVLVAVGSSGPIDDLHAAVWVGEHAGNGEDS